MNPMGVAYFSVRYMKLTFGSRRAYYGVSEHLNAEGVQKTDKKSVLGGEITIMKKVVVLATFLAATYAPSAFATAELKLTSGLSSVDILDGGVGDICLAADCVTFSGPVGSWTINVTTGIEG